MSWLNPGTWLLYGALAAALVLGVWRLDVSRQAIGYDRAQAEYTTAALKATEAARTREQQLQATATKAQNDARTRETKLAADARNLRLERDGLRNDLAASQRELPSASCESVRRRAAAVTDVFDQCAGAIESLAGKADRHASDALMFEQAWPK